MTDLQKQGAAAKAASYTLSTAGTAKKNAALEAIAKMLTERQEEWLAANAADVAAAKEAGMRPAMLDRLMLNAERIAGIVDGVRQVAALPDPIGKVDKMETRPNGLIIGRRRVPLGVIAIIFEARPNVTVDAAALCLKSGNVCILRGGKEAIRSNRCVTELMRQALEQAGLPADCISLVQDTSHDTANELMHLDGYVDVLIPRGGAGLIRAVAKEASVPVIRTGEGVCHVYVDDEADLDMAAKILYNAKCSRPSVCNAAECVLVHRDVAADFWKLALPMLDEKGVELRADQEALALLGTRALPAAESDWDAEYDDYILAVRTVGGMEEAIDFINAHGTQHSEAIITKNYFKAQRFLDAVDAAAVYVNASTRFTDGGEFGLGAEIGISTQKMHARGPMGLEELTSCKYVIYGEGQVR
ncbi:glutamate-5-semialdehyde dehydrogenase [Dysosmobacter sp.]|uniref:glutamate-5-semialdehyde dehydrogenase n=1 Tax=Dysosmobacter sp. TaxID=2591382 RepID=UPI002A9A5596|nr:glutamate-5-semialdehyde dehydrogenase [Dysosmobacter sp.]MCI6055584.1 glutamate-5-semialdehyde dehydrogenase [Dysosmobacter sp.]MDY5509046.1 glutamate-5-semialdehyde dehydrogenase [Dysosmobacter sp.]